MSRTEDSPTEKAAEGLLNERDLDAIERDHPEGLTAAQVVDLFQKRGVKLSEATFRKYVQLGLLPRSRRVGRKGKHQGSMGLYPATAARRVNAIKQMMAEAYTIEDIQKSFLRFKDEIESGDSFDLGDVPGAVEAYRELYRDLLDYGATSGTP